MARAKLLFIGIKGSVVAVDRATGSIVWQTHLAGSDFVNVMLDANNVYATTHGEVFCLDPETGDGRWHNPLKGYGWGLSSMATQGAVPDLQAIVMAERRRREQQAAAAGSTAAASS